MGKKKRQEGPNMDDNDNDSNKSCDENQNATSCPHVNKSVDLNKVKKAVGTALYIECPQCDNPLEIDDDMDFDLSIWLCLKCGNQGCGRTKKCHALQHYNTPRSDGHSLSVNTTFWHVWCYKCDNSVMPNATKKLLEIVEWLKKQNHNNSVPKLPPIALKYQTLDPIESENLKNSVSSLNLPRVRGLSNLGNTCFFNAVLQCLARTPFLVSVLEDPEAERFTLWGGKITLEKSNDEFKEATTTELSAFSGILKNSGILALKLSGELKCLSIEGGGGTVNPHGLFRVLTYHHPVFNTGEQFDSHELLRCLLDAVRSEHLRRIQAIILESQKLSTKTNPNNVNGVTKQIIKFYGQQASDLVIKTDRIFRGILVSTLQCQVCKHSSHRDEFFLDLSLPVTGEKQHPPVVLRRHKDIELMETEDKPSKAQQKKDKRAIRKAIRQSQKSKSNIISEELSTANENDNKSESEEGDADIEDNLEDCKSPAIGCDKELNRDLDSGMSSAEKVSDASPDLNPLEIDPGLTSPLSIAVSSPTLAEVDSPHSGSSEVNIELTGTQLPSASPEDYERPISRLSFVDKPTPMMEDNPSDTSPRLEPLFDTRWCTTVSARYQCDEGECSVQSCLNQFTACELMTGNNCVRCENCTKNSGVAGKSVYTNATKQLLISSPPAILILHLKRFQVSRCFPRKISKHVNFPLVLDMAPFCSTRCRDLPSIDEQQNRLLYSLYGVVEHSGTMHGGHYVAYVKVRPEIPPDHYRWQFLSKATTQSTNTPNNTNKPKSNEGGAQGDPTPPPGVWYHVSDSHVGRVSECEVLKAQAYLLFYERIL